MFAMFLLRGRSHRRSGRVVRTASKSAPRARHLRIEPLEGRRLLSLVALGVDGDSLSDEYVDQGLPYAKTWVGSLAETGVDLGEYRVDPATSVVSLPSSEASFLIPAPDRVDMIHDPERNMLYITTTDDGLLRYSLSTRSFLAPIHLGGPLRGIDISPDHDTLVVADGRVSEPNNWVHVVDLTTGATRRITFEIGIGGLEGGTYTAAFAAADTVLVSSTFRGSGWVPLRRVDLATGSVTTLASVRQSTMLTPCADNSVIAYAEANISSGEWGRYRVADGGFAESGTGWFAYEIGVSRDGTQFAVPSYNGTYVYNQNLEQIGKIGVYADEGPIGLAYSPVADVVYFAWADRDRTHPAIDVYDTTTLTKIATVDAGTPFDWVGNKAFAHGRLKVSEDGSLLFATVGGGVKVYQLIPPNEPPVATDDGYALEPDSVLSVPRPGVLENDFDPDGDPLTAVLDDGPSHGSLTLSPDGSFIYTPDDGFVGVDRFTYRATDGHFESNLATVTLLVGTEIVVNSTADPGDGVPDAAETTLREAIDAANAVPGTQPIVFDIPTIDPGYSPATGAFTIQPLRPCRRSPTRSRSTPPPSRASPARRSSNSTARWPGPTGSSSPPTTARFEGW